MRNTKKGFTLVELLVVIAILAILATVSVVGYTSFIDRANDSVAQQELTQIRDYALGVDMTSGNKNGKIDAEDAKQAVLDSKLAGVAVWNTAKTAIKYTGEKGGEAYWTLANGTITTDEPADWVDGDGVLIELLATFEFGANGVATHSDGSALDTTVTSYTDGTYTLNWTVSNVYKNARDAVGNSCIKLGKGGSGNHATLTITVPDNVTEVVVYVARYKSYDQGAVVINGETHEISTLSDNGEYTAITIDTTTTKTIELTTGTNNDTVRVAMLNTIEFIGYAE